MHNRGPARGEHGPAARRGGGPGRGPSSIGDSQQRRGPSRARSRGSEEGRPQARTTHGNRTGNEERHQSKKDD
jgi:hypothetical protein